jgi:hypothetical protein
VALTRRGYLVILLILAAVVTAGAMYYRASVDKAAADCAMPAPPEKPKTPPPKLPGFETGSACGPGETAGAAKKTP